MNDTLILKIIEYGLKKERFTLRDLQRDLSLPKDDFEFVRLNLWTGNPERANSNTIMASTSPQVEGLGLNAIEIYNIDCASRLLPSAIFSYVDHLEIVEARKAAKESKRLAWIAIVVSLGLGVVQLYLQP